MAGGSMAKGVRLLSLSYFVLSLSAFLLFLSLFFSFSLCFSFYIGLLLLFSSALNITFLSRYIVVLVSREQYFHPSSILRSRSSRISSMSLSRARVLPLFAVSPFDRSPTFSLSFSLPPSPSSLPSSLTLYTHKDGHGDVTKHVTIV